MFPLFAASSVTLPLIQAVGAFTAVFAAVIAITQMDIKRILAFSTLSQLGYMMFSLGAARTLAGEIQALGFSASMFHVFTHAFFKCMLFLGAGAVIHAVHHNDIDHMGGLRRDMPRTYWSMLVACLAIAGIFPLSGFWSKDAILLAALQGGHWTVFLVGLITGGLTAFYMFRLFFVTFHGEGRRHGPGHAVHEDPWMSFSIVALTVPTVLAGAAEHVFIGAVVPPLGGMTTAAAHAWWLPWLATLAGGSGIGVAWRLYGDGGLARAESLRRRMIPLHRLVWHKFYIDEGYLFVTHRIIFDRIAGPVKWFDRQVVDGAMNLSATVLQGGGRLINRWQNGRMQRYLAATVLGCILLLALGFAF